MTSHDDDDQSYATRALRAIARRIRVVAIARRDVARFDLRTTAQRADAQPSTYGSYAGKPTRI